MEFFSLQSKSRVDSFDSVDSSFDVVSIDESIEERVDVESVDEEEAEDRDQVLVEQERDDQQDDGAWENLNADTRAVDDADVDVEIKLDEGFEDAIEAALESSLPGALRTAPLPVKEPTSPRWRNARKALRDFYLSRAKTSEESSKHYRSYTPPPPFVAPVEIAPLRAPQRYDVELYERVIREENERNAQLSLRAFYAERDAAKAQRAADNRANERFVYESQIGSSASLGAPGGCAKTLYWETTRFVRNGTEV